MDNKSTSGATMRKVFGFLITSVGYAKGSKLFETYCKKYGIWMDDPAPDAVVLDVFAKYGRF